MCMRLSILKWTNKILTHDTTMEIPITNVIYENKYDYNKNITLILINLTEIIL